MTPEQVSTVFALMAIAGTVLGVGVLVALAIPGPRARVRAVLAGQGSALAWLVATIATLGSLYLSEVAHFTPCRLCWFQRIFMYPLSIVLLVGAIRKELTVRYYALPLSIIGLAISVWHYVVQLYPSLEGSSCDPLNPCSSRYVEVFGFISIPFMAGAGFTLITVLALFYMKANEE